MAFAHHPGIKRPRVFVAVLAISMCPALLLIGYMAFVGIFGHRMTSCEQGYAQGLADAEHRQFILSMPEHLATRFDEFYLSWDVDPVLNCRFQQRRTSMPRDTEWLATGWHRVSDEQFAWYKGYETAVASVRRSTHPYHAEILFTSVDRWKQLFESDGRLIDSKPGNDGGGRFRITRNSLGIDISPIEGQAITFSESDQICLLDQHLFAPYVILKIKHRAIDDHSLYILDQGCRWIANISHRPRQIERQIKHDHQNGKGCNRQPQISCDVVCIFGRLNSG